MFYQSKINGLRTQSEQENLNSLNGVSFVQRILVLPNNTNYEELEKKILDQVPKIVISHRSACLVLFFIVLFILFYFSSFCLSCLVLVVATRPGIIQEYLDYRQNQDFHLLAYLIFFSDPADYELTIHTGVVEGASAEVSLFVTICGTSGDTGRRRVRRLPRDSKVRLEAGGGGFHFTLANCINVGDVTHARVELGKDCWDSGVSWFMDSLSIEAIPILKGGGKNETGSTKSLTFEKQRKLVDVVRPKMIRNDNCFFAIRPYLTRQTYFSVLLQSRSCKKCNYKSKLNFHQETIKNGEIRGLVLGIVSVVLSIS